MKAFYEIIYSPDTGVARITEKTVRYDQNTFCSQVLRNPAGTQVVGPDFIERLRQGEFSGRQREQEEDFERYYKFFKRKKGPWQLQSWCYGVVPDSDDAEWLAAEMDELLGH